MKELRVAAVQMSPTGDRERNIDTASRLMDKAVAEGARIIGLPEDFSYSGDTSGKLSFAMDEKTDPAVAFLRKYAKKNKVSIIGGSIPFKTDKKNKVSNTCLVIDTKGKIQTRYDKMHLFDVSLNEAYMLNESGHIKGGDSVVTVDLLGTTIGLSICYDLRFPELYRALTLRGAKIIFVCSAFTLHTGKDHWEALLRARAIENQCYVVAPAQIGEYMPGVHTYGRTMMIDPWGQVLMKCQDKEDVIVADLDMEYLEDVRDRMPCLEHTHKKTFFSSKVYKKQS
jgi:predicted amidohydrolase